MYKWIIQIYSFVKVNIKYNKDDKLFFNNIIQFYKYFYSYQRQTTLKQSEIIVYYLQNNIENALAYNIQMNKENMKQTG